MRHGILVPVGVLLLFVFATCANAQTTSESSFSFAPATDQTSTAPTFSVPLMLTPAEARFATGAGLDAELPNSPVSGDPGAQQPTVYGVFQTYNWQIFAGYSFFRFYIASKPSLVENMNGLNFGLVYYPHGMWIGVEGEFTGEFGSLDGNGSHFALGGGGPRFRWSAPRGLELWGHVLVGGSRFTPQTALGNMDAFAYELGGGVDFNAHHQRFAYRVQADMIGTRFFGTYQFSPRIAAGIVFKY